MGYKFKVGDNVIRTKSSHNGMKIGDKGTITEIEGSCVSIKEFPGTGKHSIDSLELYRDSETGFEVGKWYKTKAGSYVKFLKITSYAFIASEYIYHVDKRYVSDQATFGPAKPSQFVLIQDLSTIQQYLPDGHPDKIEIVNTTKFRKDDYIVTLEGDFSMTSCAEVNYCFKQKTEVDYIEPCLDLRGSSSNGNLTLKFDKSDNLENWRYATKEEIAEYDRIGKPYDVTTLKHKSLVGRYLKALCNGPNGATNYSKGDYILIEKDDLEGRVFCSNGFIFGDWSYDWKKCGVELMPEGFHPDQVKEKKMRSEYITRSQCVEGEIYVYDERCIAEFPEGKSVDISNKTTTNSHKWIWNLSIRHCTKEERELFNSLTAHIPKTQEQLLEEAARRYPIGTSYIPLSNNGVVKNVTQSTYLPRNVGSGIDVGEGYVYLFQKPGIWAEVVTEDKNQSFILPEKWCVQNLNNCLERYNDEIPNNSYRCNANNHYYYYKNGNFELNSTIPEGYSEITLNQFLEHVLNKSVKKTYAVKKTPHELRIEKAKADYPIGTEFCDLVHKQIFKVKSHNFDTFGDINQLYVPVEPDQKFPNKTARLYKDGEWAKKVIYSSGIDPHQNKMMATNQVITSNSHYGVFAPHPQTETFKDEDFTWDIIVPDDLNVVSRKKLKSKSNSKQLNNYVEKTHLELPEVKTKSKTIKF